MALENRVFPKPFNHFFWAPLILGMGAAGAFYRESAPLAWTWLIFGVGAAIAGGNIGTEAVRAWRLFRQFETRGSLRDDEGVALLRESFRLYPSNAVRRLLIEVNVERGQFKECLPLFESAYFDLLDREERRDTHTLEARVLWEIGQKDRARALVAKISEEWPSFLPAQRFVREWGPMDKTPATSDRKRA